MGARGRRLSAGALACMAASVLVGCQPDYPATADVSVVNDTPTEVSILHCTSSCSSDDLQDRQVITPGGRVMVGVNGDPNFQETFVVRGKATGCLYVGATADTWAVSTARPLTGAQCPARDLR